MPESILITGVTGLIGHHLATSFLQQNKSVIGITSSIKTNKKRLLDGVKYIEIDLAQIADIKTEVMRNKELMKDVSYIVNCARTTKNLESFQNKDFISAFQHEFDLTVLANFHLVRAIIDISSVLRSICNISSIYSTKCMSRGYYELKQDLPINYGVARAALNQLTREMANDLGPKGIAVNAVLFGGVWNNNLQDFVDKYSADCAMNGMLDLEQTFPIIQFLEYANLNAITGQCINVDNGYKL